VAEAFGAEPLRARRIRSVLDGVFRMRSIPLRSFLAGSLVLALGLPGGVLAAPGSKSKSAKSEAKDPGKGTATEKDPGDPSVPPPEHDGAPRQGQVFVDALGLGDAGPVIGGRATLVARGALEGQGVTITDPPGVPELQVTLKERDAGGYRVDYVIVYDGKTVKDGAGGFDCQLCTEDELVEKVEALAVQVAPKLVVPGPEADTDPDPERDPDVKDPDGNGRRDPDPDGGIVDDDPNRLGGKGKAGVALLVVGGLGAITGTVLVIRKPEYFEVGDPHAPTEYSTTRPPGWALLGGGVAVVVVGAVLLGLDRKQAKQRAAAGVGGKKATAKLHPWFGPQGAGLGVHGRF
jgi:hypothetical protein